MTRFLALGDSYTIGEGVAESDRWPDRVVDLLRQRGVNLTEYRVIARTAWTTDELADAVAAARPRGPFDLVTLMIGVNDQYRGRSIEEFCSTFEPLFATAAGLAGDPTRTVVISIPDWGCTPFGATRDRAEVARQIDVYNAWLRGRAEMAGARWVDVTSISRCMLDDPASVTSDGLHPSGEIHRRWGLAILPAVLEVLERN